MLYITVPDRNDSMSTITLGKKEYLIRFCYNEIGDYWNFGVYDIYENPIVAMTKIVPNFPLMHFYTYLALPDGVFGAISDTGGRIGRNSFKNGEASFVYIPNSELEG
ncbi:phage baseplate plug family protein [Lacrimispora sp.]|uniref:phage baseplate plug family protein n=1 Tax=Lacrimispora sp. TaxID=2719234 RepID=UPI0028AA8C47|nr:hypothetical protein [Lacrimispora sp.]